MGRDILGSLKGTIGGEIKSYTVMTKTALEDATVNV
ncbi:hypothetical protein ACFVP8_01825 [Viridibacillus arvi]